MKAIVAILLSLIAFGSTARAADCNPKAQVHQQRAQSIIFALDLNGRIPTSEEEAFVLCMLPEKEDKQAFEQKVNNAKTAQAAQRAREEAQRKAAIEAHNRPASPQEQAQAQFNCEHMVTGPARDAGMAYCLAAWKANPHSKCASGNLPCGTVDERLCYNPYAGQRCVNGQVTSVNSSFPPWAEAFLSSKISLPNGRYVSDSASCDSAPPDAVIILQDSTLRHGRTLFNLVNAGGPQSFTAHTTGDGHNGTIGYNWNVTVNDATSLSLSWVMGNIGRYRLCAPSASASSHGKVDDPNGVLTVGQGGCKVSSYNFVVGGNIVSASPYKGDCKDGLADGQGSFTFVSQENQGTFNGNVKGNFRNGKLNGNAIITAIRSGNVVLNASGEFRENRPWNIVAHIVDTDLPPKNRLPRVT